MGTALTDITNQERSDTIAAVQFSRSLKQTCDHSQALFPKSSPGSKPLLHGRIDRRLLVRQSWIRMDVWFFRAMASFPKGLNHSRYHHPAHFKAHRLPNFRHKLP